VYNEDMWLLWIYIGGVLGCMVQLVGNFDAYEDLSLIKITLAGLLWPAAWVLYLGFMLGDVIG